MNRVVKSDDLNGPLPDPRSDANWQARLEEARAKRAIALAERAKTTGPKKKRLKPWEEEGALIVDGDAGEGPVPESGLGFSDRVEAMREHARDMGPVRTQARVARDERPVGTPSGDIISDTPVTPQPPVSEPEAPVARRKPEEAASPAGAINDIFDAPEFAPDAPGGEPPESPISLLLKPEPIKPSPVPAWRQAALEDEVAAASPATVTAPEKPAEPTRSRKVSVAVLMFVAAIAVGPIWQMTRPVERGPLVFTLSAFALEPALGLTSPMFESPRPSRPGEWTPVEDSAPRAPYDVGRPSVPAKVPHPDNFAADPALGPVLARVTLGAPVAAPAGGPPPLVARLPVPVSEPVLGRNGVAEEGGSGLDGIPEPAERPRDFRNG